VFVTHHELPVQTTEHDVIVSPNVWALNLIRAVLPMTAGGTADQDFLTSTVTPRRANRRTSE